MRLHRVPWQIIVVAVAFGLRFSSPETASLSFFVLALYAFSGRAQAIQALSLSWLFTMLSIGVAPEAEIASVGRYAVIFGAATSVLLRSWRPISKGRIPIQPLVFFTALMGSGILLHSVFFSAVPDVSILRAIAWTVTVVTLIAAWAGLDRLARLSLERQLFGGLVILVLVSLPLAFTDLGYLRNGTGFQGVLNHPQAFGVTVALLAAWLGSRIIADRRPSWRLLGLFALCLVIIVMSETRTAGFGLVIALGLSVLVGWLLTGRRPSSYLLGLRSPRLLAMAALGLALLIPTAPALENRLGAFFEKRAEADGLADAFIVSRGVLVIPMIENIANSPLQGIGFGVASDPFAMEIERDPVFGLPTGAPVEKGNQYLAIWEELGLIGFMVVIGWLWFLVLRAARGGVGPLSVCFTALIMNFGEAVLFSPGGMGMMVLILLIWAGTSRPMEEH